MDTEFVFDESELEKVNRFTRSDVKLADKHRILPRDLVAGRIQ